MDGGINYGHTRRSNNTNIERRSLKDRIKIIGPGAIITASFIGPGTVTTATRAGASLVMQFYGQSFFP